MLKLRLDNEFSETIPNQYVWFLINLIFYLICLKFFDVHYVYSTELGTSGEMNERSLHSATTWGGTNHSGHSEEGVMTSISGHQMRQYGGAASEPAG